MIRAFVTAKVGSSDYLGATKTIKEKIAKIQGVLKVDITFGRYDIIAEVEAKDLDELSRLVTDQIKSIPNILSTETFICYQP
jgi:Lrp/AsnC family transcriptional regulator for asnA, asnC and gidA